jgi:hypothetical protein
VVVLGEDRHFFRKSLVGVPDEFAGVSLGWKPMGIPGMFPESFTSSLQL